MDELDALQKKRDDLLKTKSDNERKKALKAEIFRLEHPYQAKLGNAVLNAFKPRPIAQNVARKTKLKKKVASMADVDKALSGLMKM